MPAPLTPQDASPQDQVFLSCDNLKKAIRYYSTQYGQITENITLLECAIFYQDSMLMHALRYAEPTLFSNNEKNKQDINTPLQSGLDKDFPLNPPHGAVNKNYPPEFLTMWLLASAIRHEGPEEATIFFKDMLNKFSDEQLAHILQPKVEEGPYKGTNILLLLAVAIANGHPGAAELFKLAMSKLSAEPLTAALQAKAEAGADKGINILWALADAIARGRPGAVELFTLAMSKLSAEALTAALQAKAEEGADKGKTILWWLAVAIASNRPGAVDLFTLAMSKLSAEALTAALQAKAEEGPDKGQTILWWLAVAIASNRPGAADLFKLAMSKLSAEALTAALQAKAEEGPSKGQTILWWLAVEIVDGRPGAAELFNTFLAKLTPEQWAVLDIQAKAPQEPAEAKIIENQLKGQKWLSTYYFYLALSKAPMIKPNAGSQGGSSLIEEKAISEAINRLFELAGSAAQDGHREVYLALGNYLKEIGSLDNAYSAYHLVPSSCEGYAQAQINLAEMFYAGRLFGEGDILSPENLENESPQAREARLARAYGYIHKVNESSLEAKGKERIKALKYNILTGYFYGKDSLYNSSRHPLVQEYLSNSDEAQQVLTFKKLHESQQKIESQETLIAHLQRLLGQQQQQLEMQQQKTGELEEKLHALLGGDQNSLLFLNKRKPEEPGKDKEESAPKRHKAGSTLARQGMQR